MRPMTVNNMFEKMDTEFGPHEAAMLATLPESAKVVVAQARAIGIPWSTIWALAIQYGGQFLSILEAIIAALNAPVPTPIPPVVPPA
jgi:hypothetical protein